MAPLDHKTMRHKLMLRRGALQELEAQPVVLETHGGYGRLWYRLYQDVPSGIVFEKEPRKAEQLARQRPTWAVYEADCVGAIAAGVGFHLPVNFIDVDPWGDPWPVIEAVFGSHGLGADRVAIVVTDGLRKTVRLERAFACKSLVKIVQKIGNGAVYENYLEICQLMLKEKAEEAGYNLLRWAGSYCGHLGTMAEYAAILEKQPGLS